MRMTFEARYENGVLVPEGKVALPEHGRVTVTVDTRVEEDDPRPKGGVELVDWWARHRIQIDPAQAQAIIDSDDFLDQEGDDEP